MNLGVASIIDIGFPGGPSNNYPSWLDGLGNTSLISGRNTYRRQGKYLIFNPEVMNG
jgi:hypothetical protein